MPAENTTSSSSETGLFDIRVIGHGHVTEVVIDRPPHNFIDAGLMTHLSAALTALDTDDNCRAIVLASEGKNFCAGADFSRDRPDAGAIYDIAIPLFDLTKPMVAAVQGAAVGAGVGLAVMADFRIGTPASRFSVGFNRLGFHPGFGLSHTLPHLIGAQQAALLFYTGRRIDGARALQIGLVDELVEPGKERVAALALALEIAQSAPLAVQSTRKTLRQRLVQDVRKFNHRERQEQSLHFGTKDFQEAIRAAAARETPNFKGE